MQIVKKKYKDVVIGDQIRFAGCWIVVKIITRPKRGQYYTRNGQFLKGCIVLKESSYKSAATVWGLPDETVDAMPTTQENK